MKALYSLRTNQLARNTSHNRHRRFTVAASPWFSARVSSLQLRYNAVPSTPWLHNTRYLSSEALAANKKKPDSNPFLDNLGKIFLGGIGLLIATLVRSFLGSTNRNKARASLEETSSLDPLEIDDLRVANSELKLPVFRQIMADVIQEFPSKHSTYCEFNHRVRKTMKRLKGDAFTIQLGHLIDRTVLNALKEHGQTTEDPQPLSFWLTVLSLALASTVPERILALFEVLQVSNEQTHVTLGDARTMVGYLQDTCQLVPDSQVVPTSDKYPVQQYARGTPADLFEWDGSESDEIDVDAFAAILRSSAVCAWGECYHRKKFV